MGLAAVFTVALPVCVAKVKGQVDGFRHGPERRVFNPVPRHDQLADKGNPGMFQGSILDNRIKEHRRFGVTAWIDGLIEDVPEMAVTSPRQIVE